MDEEAAMTAMGLERESYRRRGQREEGLRCKGLQRADVLGRLVEKMYQRSETGWLGSGALYGMAAVVRLATFRLFELQTQAPRRWLHARNLEPATIYIYIHIHVFNDSDIHPIYVLLILHVQEKPAASNSHRVRDNHTSYIGRAPSDTSTTTRSSSWQDPS